MNKRMSPLQPLRDLTLDRCDGHDLSHESSSVVDTQCGALPEVID